MQIEVSPLPDKNVPAPFAGMVGKAALSSSVIHGTVKANEPVTYSITIGGEGNLSLLQAPRLNLGPDIQVYDPKPIDKIDRNGDNLSGTRTFEYTLMPHKAGKFTIPSQSFSYFDPAEKQYFESKTNPISIIVEKNENAPASNDASTSETGKEIDKIPGYIKWSILFSFSAMLLFAVLALMLRKSPKRTLSDNSQAAGEGDTSSGKDYAQLLGDASKLAMLDQYGQFYTVMLNALNAFICETFDLSFAELSQVTICQVFEQNHIPETLISEYLNCIDQCEMVKYAPTRYSANKENIYNDSKSLIDRIMELSNKNS